MLTYLVTNWRITFNERLEQNSFERLLQYSQEQSLTRLEQRMEKLRDLVHARNQGRIL